MRATAAGAVRRPPEAAGPARHYRGGMVVCLGPGHPARALGRARLRLRRRRPARRDRPQGGAGGERADRAAGRPTPSTSAAARRSSDELLSVLPLLGEWHGEGQAAGTGGDHRFGQWVRFSHDGRGFLAYESRTWRLTDDGTIVGPDVRESGFWRPRGDGTRSSCSWPAPDGAGGDLRRHRPDDDELGAGHRRRWPARPTPPTSPAPSGSTASSTARSCTPSTAPSADEPLRPTMSARLETDPMSRTPRHAPPPATTRARSPTPTSTPSATSTRSLATSLGTRPGDDRLPDLSPAGLEAEASLVRDTLAELDRVLAAEPRAGRRPGRAAAAPGCCASGSPPSSTRTRRARASAR